jgi:hypothetical protein
MKNERCMPEYPSTDPTSTCRSYYLHDSKSCSASNNRSMVHRAGWSKWIVGPSKILWERRLLFTGRRSPRQSAQSIDMMRRNSKSWRPRSRIASSTARRRHYWWRGQNWSDRYRGAGRRWIYGWPSFFPTTGALPKLYPLCDARLFTLPASGNCAGSSPVRSVSCQGGKHRVAVAYHGMAQPAGGGSSSLGGGRWGERTRERERNDRCRCAARRCYATFVGPFAPSPCRL